MNDGVEISLSELIAFRRFAYQVRYRPERRSSSFGNHLSKWRGRGMDFSEVRNYQAGDEVRHMEWRVTARTGRPHIKLYQEERERPTMILADFNPSMYFGTRVAFKSVVAAKLAAIIAWTVVAQGDRVGGLIHSVHEHSEFVPRARDSGVLPFLAALSDYTKSRHNPYERASSSFNDSLQRLRRVTKPGSIVVLISDFYPMNQESERQLSRMRAHNDVLAYHIADPLELTPPKPEQYAMTDGQNALLLDTTRPSVQSAYHTYCEQRINTLASSFKRLQIQYVQVTSEQDLPLLVRQTFPRRTNV